MPMVEVAVTEESFMDIERPGYAPFSKRQRLCGGEMSLGSSSSSGDKFVPSPSSPSSSWPSSESALKNSRDCYEEVLRGCYFNGGGQIHDSWLIGCTQYPNTTEAPSQVHGNDDDCGASLDSLHRQLLQIKRRLWPAAEECARVCDSPPTPLAEFHEARRICNPLELLGEGRKVGLNKMFMNRSAIKLANMDALLGFTLCYPTAPGDSSTAAADFDLTNNPDDPFLFVDLCGAPGGFSEYIMKRCQTLQATTSCRGYGMSLQGSNEHGQGIQWRIGHLSDFRSNFHTHYRVCEGHDGTGDLYKWENVMALQEEIQLDLQHALGYIPQQQQQHGGVVHLVVADGGFDAQRDSECQEQLSQKLIVCQVAASLQLLQTGGTLLTKMFGFQTSAVRCVMRDLRAKFERITILKPISSRPASSERYVVCTGFRGLPHDWDGRAWRDQMFLGDWNFQRFHNSTSNAMMQDPNFEAFLNEIDGDMLRLNIKTCFAILSCLERKTRAVGNGDWDESLWCPELPPVNVDMYKHVWRLH